MALVGPQFPVLLFPPDDLTRASFPALASDFAARGAPVLAADCQGEAGGLAGATPLPVPAPLHPMIDPVVQLTAFYRFADQLSRNRGLDPDAPPFLAKVTRTQ
jgi:glucosamine--fructose-6-phosphate aminotransferase (isomerizing)